MFELGRVCLGLALGCASLVACGGSSGTDGTGGTDGGGGMGGSSSGSCPAAPPADGSSCTAPWTGTGTPKAHCSWGDDPRPACRTIATCLDGKWTVTAPGSACSTPALPSSCLNPPPADQTTCSDQTLSCWYADGTRCWCSECQGGSGYPSCQTINPPEWYCATPGPGCPTVMPQAGSPCSSPDASCGPDCNFVIKCQAGVWQWLPGSCPICAAPNTPIATPSGERAIATLRVGDLVYSVDHDAIVAVPVARVGRTEVHAHHVVRVELAGGGLLEISPGHPTADGKTFAELTADSWLDAQHRVLSVSRASYEYDATYDILPASSTGTYFAAGALIGSTLSTGTGERF